MPRAGWGRRGLCFFSFCLRLEEEAGRDSWGSGEIRVIFYDCNFGCWGVAVCADVVV